jgi:hypothetical protein
MVSTARSFCSMSIRLRNNLVKFIKTAAERICLKTTIDFSKTTSKRQSDGNDACLRTLGSAK